LGFSMIARTFPVGIKIDDAVLRRVSHTVGEDHRAGVTDRRSTQLGDETFAIKDVVAKDQRDTPAVDKITADEKGLRQSAGTRLHGIVQIDAPGLTVPEQSAKIAARRSVW